MRSIQEILDVIIESGYYGEHSFMCHAASAARCKGLITRTECAKLLYVVNGYVGVGSTLSGALFYNRLPRSQSATTTIYRDWDNRPKLDLDLCNTDLGV